jgi:uncharacterized protein YggE
MKKPSLLLVAAIAVLLSAQPRALAEDKPEPRLVTVAGEAEVNVAPDEVVFDMTVSTFNKELRLAKAQTDERLKNLIALAKRHGVAEADTQTDYINLAPHYRGNNEARTLLGYSVRKDLVLTLRDVARAEGLLSELLDSASVTRINSVSFRSSQMRKYRDQARDLAMRAAREKAAALAGAVGQKIGKAYSIEEEVPSRAYASQNVMSNNISTVESDGSTASEGTLALGLIKISARVTVKFELE